MPKPFKIFFFFFLLLACTNSLFAQTVKGIVTDTSGKPLAFATIKLGETKNGLVADLHGRFNFRLQNQISFIHVSHLGYAAKKIFLDDKDTLNNLLIALEPMENTLTEVVVASNTNNKLKRIINNTINNRNINNPDKYDWYQCMVYYKTTIDMVPAHDSLYKNDTSRSSIEWRQFMRDQHLLISETYSRRTWQRPQKLQEEILASRVSGFKKALFSTLVTDVLPFHSYNDFITLNEKDFYNPTSSGALQRFDFYLEDEILQGKDTLWIISFTPKKDIEQLSGSMYIHSNKFAIAHLIAHQIDTALKREMGIEQQYALIGDKWFPHQLNYYLDWKNIMGTSQQMRMKGTSVIDSVSFVQQSNFNFDRARTIKLTPGADELEDSTWRKLRTADLNEKEDRSYSFLDSIGIKYNFDRLSLYMNKLIDERFPLGAFDVDIKRLYSYNAFEGSRFGIGLQTNEKISKHFSIGGWFGYGTKDKNWKYGAFAEIYGDDRRDLVLRLSYRDDLRDPGRLQIHKELDKNFLRSFLLNRADRVQSYAASIKKRLGYFETAVSYTNEEIQPQYTYALMSDNKLFTSFTATEATLQLRYAYAERTAPIFGRYYSTGSKFPIIYSKITAGTINNNNNNYVQLIGAISWRKHMNRLGDERFLLIAGKTFSDKTLPLSKVFAGNGFAIENQAAYVFGGMQTMYPYEYYTDEFINFYWNHNFDFKIFNKKINKNLSSSPMLAIGYNVLWGRLRDTAAHKFVAFSVPDVAYHEAGVLINRLLRMKIMGMYYMNFNTGYFYHLQGTFNHKKNGRVVFAVSVDL